MLLYLVRHGKAEPGIEDAARPLTPAGRKAVRRMADRLAGTGMHIARLETSDLVRAKETAEILAAALGGTVVEADDLYPSANVERVVQRLPTDQREPLMLVGHLPFMGRLATSLLTGNPSAQLLRFRTGAVACLGNDNGWWELQWFLPPDLA